MIIEEILFNRGTLIDESLHVDTKMVKLYPIDIPTHHIPAEHEERSRPKTKHSQWYYSHRRERHPCV